MPTPRYVILHHRTVDGEHWDFMLETGDVLAAWQLVAEPTGPERLPIAARRIGDHRRAYLEYTGPVSGARGLVTRVDAGVYHLIEQTSARWEFELVGGRLAGRFVFVRQPDGEAWHLAKGVWP